MSVHEPFMQRCLELAQLGKGYAVPNPMVGAVLVHDGRIIGEGWHREYGKPHAEVNCLESVIDMDRHLIAESTMYVSLEPCAHHGKTPPCATRLVEEKVKQVIVCNADPFDKVNGSGFRILRDGDIVTETGILEASGRWVNRRFFCFHEQKRPYIILKWAQTANGYFAPYGNKRYQISNAYSTRLVHKWRTEEAAILVGTNTALADDPQLTAREWKGKQPLRLVMDRSLILPKALSLFNTDADTWVFNDRKEAQNDNVKYVNLDFESGLLDGILQKLYEANIQSLIVEGGAKLLNSFIEEDLWDEARIFTSSSALERGIAAPLVTNARHAFDTSLGSDTLSIYTRTNSPYVYIQGMEL